MQAIKKRTLLWFVLVGAATALLVVYYSNFLVTSVGVNNTVQETRQVRPVLTNKSQPYICGTIVGRTGNALFKYASLLGLGHVNNMTLVLRDDSVLKHVLQNPPKEAANFEALCGDARPVHETRCQSFEDSLAKLARDDFYFVHGCLISWEYFEPIKRDIPRLLAFKEDVMSVARRIVGHFRRVYNMTLVGMHVRRDDHTGLRAYWSGHKPVTTDYLYRAMNYFRWRFGPVHFVVASDEREWCRQRLTQDGNDVTILGKQSAETDMALLSLTDHMIISVGTFGWWAGYLNPGVKSFMQDFVVPGSEFSQAFKSINPKDYFYPEWIPL